MYNTNITPQNVQLDIYTTNLHHEIHTTKSTQRSHLHHDIHTTPFTLRSLHNKYYTTNFSAQILHHTIYWRHATSLGYHGHYSAIRVRGATPPMNHVFLCSGILLVWSRLP